MAYEQKDNSGSLFNNSKKEKDSHPDRTGSAMIDGKAYWVSGWVKKDRNGNPWMSLSFKPKEQKPATYSKADTVQRQERAATTMNDEIPF